MRFRDLKSLLLLFVLLFGSSPPGIAGTSAPGVPKFHRSEGGYPQTVEMLEEFIEREVKDKDLPGFAIALVDGQRIVWQKGFGHSDPEAKKPVANETIFRVGSVSKLFTDIAVMKLVEAGKMDLDAPVTKYIPEFKPENPFGKPITLRQLMSHRSGLVREPPLGHYFDDSGTTLKETVASLNRTKLVYAPETRQKYSNAGIAVVGYVLEKTQNEPFAEYLKRTLLQPLGMKDSSFEPEQEIERHLAKARMTTVFEKSFPAPTFELGMAPAGSMYTTTGDLAKFASAIFAAEADSTGAFLKKETLEKMWEPQFAEPGKKTGGGIGFFVSDLEGSRSVGHGGAIYGFSTQFTILPEEKLGVIAVSTEDVSNGVTSRVANLALRSMLSEKAGKPVEAPEITLPVDAQSAKSIAGRYASEENSIDLIERGGKLWMIDSDGGVELQLRILGDDLIADDKLGFGPLIKRGGAKDSIRIGERTYKRVPSEKPAAAKDDFNGLIGEYGPDYNVSYVFERDGKLWLLIEQIEFDQLKQVSKDVYEFPNGGLYHGERVEFRRDGRGRATELIAAGISFKRRNIGPDEGAEQLKVNPVRPVKDLIEEALKARPPVEKGEFRETDLVELAKLDPTIKLDVRYATTNNLFNSVFYSQPRAFMQRPAAEAVVRISEKLREKGYGLLVHDAYRPWYVTKVFWDATPEELKIFVADPSQGSRHNRGAAVDLSLYDLKTGEPVRMVGTYDETTDRSYPNYPGGTSLERWHRELLRDAMESDGFTVYEAEWWHFDFNDWRKYRIGNERFEEIGRLG
ncbi:MAG: serine hydrolase [Acidobacteria bacterium]|nr:MAG: serine hydrolase [Acidobacteriota bacterium]REJ98058.1 MAG: serine hydrolase [Acidobacteriota bacterium]REK16801.1 MAG: serine hydrolase [Acidobacteriota bacterium]REK42712.1 MAG: serine hydrolase [Acidobacteriota bacterium]